MHANEGFWRSRKVAFRESLALVVSCEVEFLTVLKKLFCHALQIGSHAQIAQIHVFYFNKFIIILILEGSTSFYVNIASARV